MIPRPARREGGFALCQKTVEQDTGQNLPALDRRKSPFCLSQDWRFHMENCCMAFELLLIPNRLEHTQSGELTDYGVAT